LLAAWLSAVPDRYLQLTPPRQIARHVLLSRRRDGRAALDVVHRLRKGVSEVTVCADDAPGLLSRIAGVLLSNRIDVLAAQITSRARPGGAEAIDVFIVRDRYGRLIAEGADGPRFRRVAEDLERVLGGATSVEALIQARKEPRGLKARVVPEVRTEIEVDNEVSRDFSVVDVYTHDRPGVLYTITRTLARLDLDIQLSKVATEASRVADVFYVREAQGGKLTAERVDELTLLLSEELGRLAGAG
jgi:[protein-PII] uridylyltransferase